MIELDDLLELIETVVDTDKSLSQDMAFSEVPGWDSVNAMRLFSQLERDSEKKLSMKAYLATNTIDDVFQLIQAS